MNNKLINNLIKRYQEYDIELIKLMKYLINKYKKEGAIFKIQYSIIEKEINISRFKQKKYINAMYDNNFLNYEKEGNKFSKNIIIKINEENETFKYFHKNNENSSPKLLKHMYYNIKLIFKTFKASILSIITTIKIFLSFYTKGTNLTIKIRIIKALKPFQLALKDFQPFKLKTLYIYNKVIKYISNKVNKVRKYIKFRKDTRSYKILKNKTGEVTNTCMGTKKQNHLIATVSKTKDHRKILENKNIPMFPFKINGNKHIKDYAIQKILKARQGYLDWDKVTHRDLACYLSFVTDSYLPESLKIHGRLATRGSKVIKQILKEHDIEKEEFVRLSYYLIQEYKNNYLGKNGFNGINWSFLENKYYRENLFKISKENLVNYISSEEADENKETKNEKIKRYMSVLGVNKTVAEVQYYVIEGYDFNKPPKDWNLKKWNDLCRELEEVGGMIEEITLADEKKEKQLLNKGGSN